MDIELKLCALLPSFSKVLSKHVDDRLQLLNICHLLVEGLDPIILALKFYLLLMVLVSLLLEPSDSFLHLIQLAFDNA